MIEFKQLKFDIDDSKYYHKRWILRIMRNVFRCILTSMRKLRVWIIWNIDKGERLLKKARAEIDLYQMELEDNYGSQERF